MKRLLAIMALVGGTAYLFLLWWFPEGSADVKFGRYIGKIILELLPSGREMRVHQAFRFEEPTGRMWDVPAGAITDGASFPRVFWNKYPPFVGKYRDAAVVHDYYCDDPRRHDRTWQETHEMFYFAMRASGVDDATATVMFAAVYFGGPRWGLGARSRGPAESQIENQDDLKKFYEELEIAVRGGKLGRTDALRIGDELLATRRAKDRR